MKYRRYIANIKTLSSSKPVDITVYARNEDEAEEIIERLPEFVRFRTYPVLDK